MNYLLVIIGSGLMGQFTTCPGSINLGNQLITNNTLCPEKVNP